VSKSQRLVSVLPIMLAIMFVGGLAAIKVVQSINGRAGSLIGALSHSTNPVYLAPDFRLSASSQVACPAASLVRNLALADRVVDTRVDGLRYQLTLIQHVSVCIDGHTIAPDRIRADSVTYAKIDEPVFRVVSISGKGGVYTAPCIRTGTSRQTCTFIDTPLEGTGRSMWGHVYKAAAHLHAEVNARGELAVWLTA
jgi:hypothetical protein